MAAFTAARSANAPTRTRCSVSPGLATGTGAAAVAPVVTRRTVTANPSPRRSFDSVTASRSGRLGRTTAPSRTVSADSPLSESFFVMSEDAPATTTSYLSAGPLDGSAAAAEGDAPPENVSADSATPKPCAFRPSATFFAVAGSRNAPTCTHRSPVGSDFVRALVATFGSILVIAGFGAGSTFAGSAGFWAFAGADGGLGDSAFGGSGLVSTTCFVGSGVDVLGGAAFGGSAGLTALATGAGAGGGGFVRGAGGGGAGGVAGVAGAGGAGGAATRAVGTEPESIREGIAIDATAPTARTTMTTRNHVRANMDRGGSSSHSSASSGLSGSFSGPAISRHRPQVERYVSYAGC